ncbi:WD40 repeat-like protein [Irpex rosettiformis]|uniref:WD40 repeat-like protein n=1 Tax=Irpex rosettiformis TaxID=378272 RepID=A0ACB8U791_9APHY|nr:WD40 repeat-like protein [Irpex rosettiformis]
MDSPLILPICTVQPDFNVSVRDVNDGVIPEDKFWVSCYKAGEESVHGEVNVTLNEHDRSLVDFDGKKGVSFKAGNEHTYLAACEARGIPFTKLLVPEKTFSDPLPQSSKGLRISAFDVAPDGSQFATGYNDGSVYLLPTYSSVAHSIARKTHLSVVTSLRFFPSSRVLLTSSTDFSLSILPADLPDPSPEPVRVSPVRTLKGHTRAVTSSAIIARGRTILSASKDASLRLWDVSSGTQIRMICTKNLTSINAISAGEKSESVFTPPPDDISSSPPEPNADPREVETADKVVWSALANGNFEVFDLNTKLPVYYYEPPTPRPSSLESIAYSSAHSLLATGSLNGVVMVYDTRSLGTPLTSFKRNGASIEDVAFISSTSSGEVGLAIATSDGLPYVASIRPEGPSVRAELIGTDCDGVRCVRVGSEGTVWTAGDDGIVRRYGGLLGSS